jgi:hypothetical protein
MLRPPTPYLLNGVQRTGKLADKMDYETEARLARTLDEIVRLSGKRRYRWPSSWVGGSCLAAASVMATVAPLTFVRHGCPVTGSPYLLGGFAVSMAVSRGIGGTRAAWITAGLWTIASFWVIRAPSIWIGIEWALAMLALVVSMAGVKDGDRRSACRSPPKRAADIGFDSSQRFFERLPAELGAD